MSDDTKTEGGEEEAGEEAIDGTGEEIEPSADHDLAVREGGGKAELAQLETPVQALDLVGRMDTISDAMDRAMTKDVDYGVIPGTDKPALLKPGSEKLGVLFQLDLQPENEERWDGDHLTVKSRVVAYHAPTGQRLGAGEGMCSTREKKYAKRKQNLTCPECGTEAVLKSKHRDRDTPDAPPGYFCWKKKNGCGANFPHNDERITSQKVGEIDNPDLADTWNTVLKMAEKRARVDCVLAVTGASALFTQDVDEQQGQDRTAPGMGPAEEPPPKWGGEADKALRTACGNAITYLFDGDADKAREKIGQLESDWGYLPGALAGGGGAAGSIVKAREKASGDEPAAEGSG